MLTSVQWQTLIAHRGPYDTCDGVQLVISAILGGVYGVLSKVSRFLRHHRDHNSNLCTEPNHTYYKPGFPHARLLLGQALRHV
jgi:hypothetical protein